MVNTNLQILLNKPYLPVNFSEKVDLFVDFLWENPIKYLCRKIFYKLIGLFSDTPQLSQVTGFGIMDMKASDRLMEVREQDPNYGVRNLVMEYGFKIKLIEYTQNKRAAGKSSYNVMRYFDFAVSTLCRTSTKVLHCITILGFITSFLSFVIALFYFVYKLLHWNSFSAGIAPMLIGLFFMSGVQLLCIGLIGEYISIIITRISKKPLVIEKETINC